MIEIQLFLTYFQENELSERSPLLLVALLLV